MMKSTHLLLLLSLLLFSCNKEEPVDDSNPNPNDTTSNSNGDTNQIVQPPLDLDKNYSYFDIEVDLSVVQIMSIVNSPYGPSTAYGQQPYIDFRVNDDNTMDIFWRSVSQWKMARVSLDDQSLIGYIDLPVSTNSYTAFLGFDKIGKDDFVIGYSKDNAHGNSNSEAWYTRFTPTSVKYSTRIFGEQENTEVGSKGFPGGWGLGTVVYQAQSNSISLNLAHTEKWPDGVRHQAGYLGFIDATNGEVIENNGVPVGDPWLVSHNFDYRCIPSGEGEFYALNHGDAYPRALVAHKWNHNDGVVSSFNYYDIQNGSIGQNSTGAFTGDLIEMGMDKIGVVYATEDGRDQKDLRFCSITGFDGSPAIVDEKWITSNEVNDVTWGAKIISYGNHYLVGWNEFDDRTPVASRFMAIDETGQALSDIQSIDYICLYPSQSFRKSADGKEVIWISGVDMDNRNTLRIHRLKEE